MKLNTIRAAMLGHAVADALGVPVEFTTREQRRRDPVTGWRGYGAHHVPAGTWSDDTSMAIAALDSLTRGVDYADMMTRFVSWWRDGAYTATGVTFDMGIATRRALQRFRQGEEPLDCGLTGERDNGNGSLMRIIPAALYCKYCMPDASLMERLDFIHANSALTHGHPRSQMACGLYSCVLWALMDHPDKAALPAALAQAKAFYEEDPGFAAEMKPFARLWEGNLAALPEGSIRSSGYVVDTLEAALWCLVTTDSYADCVLRAVNLGDDTDTVAAVAGGLAGVLYGVEQVEPWAKGLIRVDELEELCARFAGI